MRISSEAVMREADAEPRVLRHRTTDANLFVKVNGTRPLTYSLLALSSPGPFSGYDSSLIYPARIN